MVALIELAGVHGSGKSTIAEELKLLGCNTTQLRKHFSIELTDDQSIWKQRVRFIRHAISVLFFNPNIGWHLFVYWLRCRPDVNKTRQAIKLASCIYQIDQFRKTHAQTTVIDEGLLHLIASISIYGNRIPSVDALVASLLPGRIDVVIYIMCTVDVAFSRLRGRIPTGSPLDAWPDEIALRRHEQAQKVIENAILAAERAGVKVIRVDSTESPPQVIARKIADIINTPEQDKFHVLP